MFRIRLLGEAIDIALEFEATESRVGAFKADIVAKEVGTEDRVIIENQLEIPALAGLERLRTRHPEAAANLRLADVLVDAMRGRSSTSTRVRVKFEHVSEGLRPTQDRLDPDYPLAVPRRREGNIIRHPSEDLRDLGARSDLDLIVAAERLRATPSPRPPSSSNVIDRSRVPPARRVGRPTQAPQVPTRRRARGRG